MTSGYGWDQMNYPYRALKGVIRACQVPRRRRDGGTVGDEPLPELMLMVSSERRSPPPPNRGELQPVQSWPSLRRPAGPGRERVGPAHPPRREQLRAAVLHTRGRDRSGPVTSRNST